MMRLSAAAGTARVSRSVWAVWVRSYGLGGASRLAHGTGLSPPLPVHEARIQFFAETLARVRRIRAPGVQLDLF